MRMSPVARGAVLTAVSMQSTMAPRMTQLLGFSDGGWDYLLAAVVGVGGGYLGGAIRWRRIIRLRGGFHLKSGFDPRQDRVPSTRVVDAVAGSNQRVGRHPSHINLGGRPETSERVRSTSGRFTSGYESPAALEPSGLHGRPGSPSEGRLRLLSARCAGIDRKIRPSFRCGRRHSKPEAKVPVRTKRQMAAELTLYGIQCVTVYLVVCGRVQSLTGAP